MSQPQVIPNLIQGVSQQAAQQRRDTQCEEQFDCFNSVADGAGARPHFDLVKLWPGRDLTGAYLTEMLSGDENYLVGILEEAPFAINLADGTDASFTVEATDGYLDGVTGLAPRDQFRAQVVEDTIFLINRQKTVSMDATQFSAATFPQALIFVRAYDYASEYLVNVNGTNGNTNNAFARYVTPHSDVGSDQDKARTTYIAEGLVSGSFAVGGTGLNNQNGYSATRYGSVLYITRADHGDFIIETADGNGDDFMYAIKGTVQAFSKLPAKGVDGFIVKVSGEDKTKADDYYVRFTGEPATGFWDETVAPSTKTHLDKSTMPHLMEHIGLNAFKYRASDWSTRIAGDETSAKDPSFVGKQLRDVFYHENRLALLYNGGCVWSKARFPFTFFPDTVQTVLDDAPVDTKLVPGQASRGTSNLDFAVQVNEALYLWSPRTQFRIDSGQDNFKQDSVASKPSTSYEYARTCTPLSLGQFLYFATDVGPWATMRSVQFQNGRVNGDVDVSRHVAKYIRAGVRWLAASETLGVIFVATDGDPGILSCYNFLFEQQEYLQSAWNKWRIPGGNILWVSILDNRLRVLQQRPEGVALLSADLTPKAVDDIEGAEYLTRLDMRVDETQVSGLAYDAGTDTSSFTLPYAPTGPDLRVVTSEDKAGGFSRGRVFESVSVAGSVVTVRGDLTGYRFYAGQRIRAERLESEFFVRNDKGIVPNDRLTLDTLSLEMADTGYTRIEVSVPHYVNPKVYEWEARTAGLPGSTAGTPKLDTDKLPAPIRQSAKEARVRLINDSFLPSYWQALSYDYTITPR